MSNLNCTYWKGQFQRQNHTERKCTTITETQYNKFMSLNFQSWTMEQPFTLPWTRAITLTSWISAKIFFFTEKIKNKQKTKYFITLRISPAYPQLKNSFILIINALSFWQQFKFRTFSKNMQGVQSTFKTRIHLNKTMIDKLENPSAQY